MSNLSIPSPTSFTCRRFHCVHRDVSVCTAVQVRYLHFCEKGGCNTQGSHVITHRSTNWACRCLTSQIGRDGVLSPEYGRIQCGAHTHTLAPKLLVDAYTNCELHILLQ